MSHSVSLAQEMTVLGAGPGQKLDHTLLLPWVSLCNTAHRLWGRVREQLGTGLRAAIDHTESLPGQFAGMRGELMAVFKGYYT